MLFLDQKQKEVIPMGLAEELRNVYKYGIIKKENSNEEICFQKNIRSNFNHCIGICLYGTRLGSGRA